MGPQGPKGDRGDDGANGKDGKGIVAISLVKEDGKDKTYAVKYTDGSEFLFTVKDGEDGKDGAAGKAGMSGGAVLKGAEKTSRKTSDYTETSPERYPSSKALSNAVAHLLEKIAEAEAKSDVVDVVGTHAELEAYDTSALADKDVIKVLEDEENNSATTYWRWSADDEEFSLIGTQGPFVTTNTAQDITATKTFKTQQRIQSGQPDGCLVIGADVSATTLTDGTRKLGRMVFPTNEDTTLNCAFVSCDTQGIGQGQTIQNCAEFGGRPGDTSSTSPDVINFTVATEHNTTNNTKKKAALSIDKDGANFTVAPQYNGSPLVTTDTQQTIPVKKIFQTTVWNGGLTIKRTTTGSSLVVFENSDNVLGGVGLSPSSVPISTDRTNQNALAIVRGGAWNNPSVGNSTTPVYVDSNGMAQPCSGIALAPTGTTLENNSTVTLASNTIYNGGTLTAFTIQLPTGVDNSYTAEIDFTSGATATTFSYPASLKWIEGDNVVDQVFTPSANKRYICMIVYDGTQFVGTVRGVE